MQKLLERRLTNTPTDTSLVRGNCDSVLNSLETDSVQSLKTSNNNPEENHSQRKGSSDTSVQNIVYVLNRRGQPLMPTCQAKAGRLLKGGKARVFKRFPFTIQLMIATGETKQPITLKQDTGYKFIGMSAVTNKAELFSAEVEIRTDIVKLLAERKKYRQNRRCRLWYRKQRYLNRKRSELTPSNICRLNTHLRIIEEVYKILPITKIIVEVAAFDIQKIKNPEIAGKGYQEGVQKDFWNVREYVLYRDNHMCQHCEKDAVILNVHHIESRKTGGNRLDNLITLCETCHEKYHQGKMELKVKKTFGFKAETAMSVIRWRLVDVLKLKYSCVEHTYGYITKSNRIRTGLAKSHANDAFCVGTVEKGIRSFCYTIIQKRKNNRGIQYNRKGYALTVRKKRYKVQKYDIITISGKTYFSKGSFCKGRYFYILNHNKKYLSYKFIDRHFMTKTFVYFNLIRGG